VYADIGRSADTFAAEMARQNVIIRDAYDGYDTYSRVSMGRLDELAVFDRVFGEIYAG